MDLPRKIRIKDIAERAGVSSGTVDRVLHNRGEVKEGTRKKIMAIVEELGYTPNILAKSLALKKSKRIAVLIPDASDANPYWEIPLDGIHKAAAEISDFNTFVDTYTFNATDEDSFNKSVKSLITSAPDGVVFNPVFDEASYKFTKLLDKLEVPYVYIDINLERGNNLCYYGQNAEESGFAAAKLMQQILQANSTVLIMKLANRKSISHHIVKREEGFLKYFKRFDSKNISIVSHEIDLLEKNEPGTTLGASISKYPKVSGIFVPSSRVFKVGQLLTEYNLGKLLVVGYDIVEQNIDLLNDSIIDFLICQKPEEQGYNGIMALFNYILAKKEVKRINYAPIDIIIKENIKYYLKK